MSPGGHLVTSALACGAAYAATGSVALAAGLAAGGFLIDVDHVIDYVLVERQRDLRPAAFLRYYTEQRMRRVALLLHSYELLAVLAVLAWVTGWVPLAGYVLGMMLHLPLDIIFNGRLVSRNLVPFYSVAYRARLGFRAESLLGMSIQRSAGGFWRNFFAEFAPARPVPAAAAVTRVRPAPPQPMMRPPITRMVSPVTYEDASEARNTQASAMSSG